MKSGSPEADSLAATSFHEEQRPWVGWTILGFVCCLAPAIIYAYAMFVQLILGWPVGDRPMSDGLLMIVGPLVMVVCVGIPLLLCTARMIIDVRNDGLYIRFVPFHRRPKLIALDKVTHVIAVTYRPIRQYGGWGIRYTIKGKAYNARGNRGVRLDYANGRHLLLGSQRPEELAAAIEKLREPIAHLA